MVLASSGSTLQGHLKVSDTIGVLEAGVNLVTNTDAVVGRGR
jgi:hypothetical protein